MFSPDQKQRFDTEVEKVLGRFPSDCKGAALLEALHIARDILGWVPDDILPHVAKLLDLPVTRVYEVRSFYTMFREKKPGKHLLEVCTNVSCMARGADEIVNRISRRFDILPGETSGDDLVTLESVECLGSCGTAPMLAHNYEYVESVNAKNLDALLDSIEKDKLSADNELNKKTGPEKTTSENTDSEKNSCGIRVGGSLSFLTENRDPKMPGPLFGFADSKRYGRLRRALFEMKPGDIIEEVKKANLRGAGGAGFLTGMKWSFVPADTGKEIYFVVNADEGEPGTFKDRYIIEKDPHLLIEGIGIACRAIGAHTAYIFIRGEYTAPRRILIEAIEKARDAKILGGDAMGSGYRLDIHVHRGGGAYICGEETALLEALEGKKGLPRLKPPFPAVEGLFGSPTVVNNVQTTAIIPSIIEMGGEAFARLGSESCGGTHIFNVSGHVKQPGIYELPFGTTYREIIDHCGGMRGPPLKALIPGGASTPVLLPSETGVRADFDSLIKAGSMFGTGAVIVLEEGTCMVRACSRFLDFFHHESCGQCTPCREGCGWLSKIVHRIENGTGERGDPDLVRDVAGMIRGNTICALGDAAALMTLAMLDKFTPEWLLHVEKAGCPFPRIDSGGFQ